MQLNKTHRKVQIMQNLDFAIHDFIEIKSCRKANHILNTSAKSMRIGKSVVPRKVVPLSFCFNDLLRIIWLNAMICCVAT